MRFNFNQKGKQPADKCYAYVKAGLPDARWDLFTTLVSGSLTASPAEHQPKDLETLRKEVRSHDAAFMERLAIYFGEEYVPGMRCPEISASRQSANVCPDGRADSVGLKKNFRELALLLTAELAAITGNQEKTGALVARIVRVPMDIPLWLDYYGRATEPGRKPGRAVRKHLALLFNKLDEYQYGRSSRASQQALQRAMRWLRPKATHPARKLLFGAILGDHVRVRTTWEQEWQALYQQHYDSAEQRQVTLRDKWKEGISSFRIGYTSLLDNLRPMLCAGVSGKVLKLAAEYLGNAAAVKRSGTRPLRLLEVYRSLRLTEQGGAGMLTEALEKAVLHSTWAELGLGTAGTSVIAMDVSNSMRRPLRGGSNVQRFDVAPLLASIWKKRGDRVITGIIGNTWKQQELPDRPVLLGVDEFRSHEGQAGYAINVWLVLQDLLRKRQVADRLMVFTDYRLWDNRSFNQTAGTDLRHWWHLYREQLAPDAKLYLFDLAGYGARSLEYLDDGVCLIAGWDEKIFEVLDVLERDREMILAAKEEL